MKVFLCWSGETSRAIAEALRGWLPKVIQAVEPWMSATDITAGTRWNPDLAQQLEKTHFGVLCLTPDNLVAPWLLFEAGALSKSVATSNVCPYLFKVQPSDVTGPLSQFQAIPADKEGTWKLLGSVNTAIQTVNERGLASDLLKELFDAWWPNLETQFEGIKPKVEDKPQPRTQSDLLEEILLLARRIAYSALISGPVWPVDLLDDAAAEAAASGWDDEVLRRKILAALARRKYDEAFAYLSEREMRAREAEEKRQSSDVQ